MGCFAFFVLVLVITMALAHLLICIAHGCNFSYQRYGPDADLFIDTGYGSFLVGVKSAANLSDGLVGLVASVALLSPAAMALFASLVYRGVTKSLS